MALGIGYGLPFVAQHGTNPYKTQWSAALEGAKGAGASVEDENAGTGSCLVSRGQDVYTDGLPFTPSLLIVPQFYKEGNLYQDVPPFVAEDTTMRFTVSRNTTATRVNSSGLIESVASGVPRIDWLGQSCPALLVEASGQNLALQSENFATTWVASPASSVNVSVNSTGTLDPYGTNVADKLIDAAVSGTHAITQSVTLVSGTTYIASVFLKAGERTRGRLRTSGAAAYWDLEFNLTNGFVTGAPNAFSQSFGNGWYRIGATFTPNQASNSFVLSLSDSTTGNSGYNYSFTGTGTSGFYAFGAQVETGAIPTSYIPTTTGAVSRAADVISASGALVSGLIGQTEGTIYAEVDVKALQGTVAKTFIDIGATNNRIFIGFTSLASNTIRLQIDTSANPARVDIRSTVSSAGIIKVAAAYQSGNCVLYVNGVAGTVSANDSLSFSTLSSVFIGQTIAGTAFLNDRIRAAALYTTRLTDAQLAELTRL
jgi:hypothetical protein